MSLTLAAARDEIHTLFETVWTPTGIPLHYWDVSSDTPGDSNAAWAAIRAQWTLGRQRGLAVGVRRYEREGIVTVQIFTPFGAGMQQSDDLSKIAYDAFEGVDTPNGVWFRSVRVNSIGQMGEWYQVNVIADFFYDEVK